MATKNRPVSVAGIARSARAREKALRKDIEKKRGALDLAATTTDSFQNFAAGLGIGTGNLLSASSYGFNPITRERTLLEWIHRGSWLGGIAVDLVADDMTRGGVKILGEIEPDDIKEIQAEATVCQFWNAVCDLVKWSRLYGGGIGVMLVEGQDLRTPFKWERIGKGQFKGMIALDRWMVEPSLNNLVTDYGPQMGCPKFYRVTSDFPLLFGQVIHYSRVIRMEGIRLPYWQRVMENLWGISIIERLYDRMVALDSATTGASQLCYRSYLRTYKLENLRTIVASGGQALAGLTRFVNFMRLTQSNEGITLIDGKDEFDTHSSAAAFSGIGEALLQFAMQISGALQVPLVRLLGQSPAGLNSTGESDVRTYYDGIKQQQERGLKPGIATAYKAMALSRGIRPPDDFDIEFNSLWQLTEKEKAETASATADTLDKMSAVLSPKVILQEFKQSSEVTGIGTNITQEDIDAAEDTPAPTPEELAAEAGAPGKAAAAKPGLTSSDTWDGAMPEWSE